MINDLRKRHAMRIYYWANDDVIYGQLLHTMAISSSAQRKDGLQLVFLLLILFKTLFQCNRKGLLWTRFLAAYPSQVPPARWLHVFHTLETICLSTTGFKIRTLNPQVEWMSTPLTILALTSVGAHCTCTSALLCNFRGLLNLGCHNQYPSDVLSIKALHQIRRVRNTGIMAQCYVTLTFPPLSFGTCCCLRYKNKYPPSWCS